MNIEVVYGNIVELNVDIIVNAANKTLLGGSGVDGAIHRKAGKGLLEECRSLHGCKTGEAKMTNGYNLPAKKVIHTVGPIYRNGYYDEPKLLKNCYKNSLILAEEYRVSNNLEKVSIAFPCISTGLYAYPKDEAATIAINTVKEFNNKNINVIFVCYEKEDYNIYQSKLGRL